jgi:CHAT domain-containing protein
MARQELEQLANLLPESLLLVDRDFSPQSLLKATQQEPVSILHIASHADFSASSLLSEAKIYTRDAEIPLSILARSLNSQNKSMGLFVLNACRTAAGDERRELGIAGLALQTGAHSALGNLWYVDDVASTAFSLQFYHNLQQGLRRDQALQETQRQFRQGEIRVRGKTIINANRQVLVSDLNRSQQIQLDGALSHPYYWSGTLLSGSPW